MSAPLGQLPRVRRAQVKEQAKHIAPMCVDWSLAKEAALSSESDAVREVIRRAQEMQGRLNVVQAELADLQVTGTAGGGLVTVTMQGTGEIVKLAFDQSAIYEGDAESLAAMTMAAIRHAADQVKAISKDKMSAVTDQVERAFSEPGLAIQRSGGEFKRRA